MGVNIKRWRQGSHPPPRYYSLTSLSPRGVVVVPHFDEVGAWRTVQMRVLYARARGTWLLRGTVASSITVAARRLVEGGGKRLSSIFVELFGRLAPYSLTKVLKHVPKDKRALYLADYLDMRDRRPFDDRDMRSTVEGKVETRLEHEIITSIWDEVLHFALNDTWPEPPATMCCRPIKSKNRRFNLQWARFIYPIEKKMYAAINHMWNQYRARWGRPAHDTVMKGKNGNERGSVFKQVFESGKYVSIEVDAEKWDYFVHEYLLKIEHSLYRSVLNLLKADRKMFKRLAAAMERYGVRVKFKGGEMYFREIGGRGSGVVNTSLGNVTLMSLMMLIIVETLPFYVDYINDGDDGINALEAPHAAEFARVCTRMFAAWGIFVKVQKPTSLFEKLNFCQCQPVMVDGECRLIRAFPEVLCKDTIIRHDLKLPKLLAHLKAVGMGGLALNSGVPVLQEFYKMLIRWAGDATPAKLDRESGLARMSKGMEARETVVADSTRHSFELAFDCNRWMQSHLEEKYRTLELDPSVTDIGSVLSTVLREDVVLQGYTRTRY